MGPQLDDTESDDLGWAGEERSRERDWTRAFTADDVGQLTRHKGRPPTQKYAGLKSTWPPSSPSSLLLSSLALSDEKVCEP